MTLRDAVSRVQAAEMEIVVICLPGRPQAVPARPAQTLTFKYVFSPQSALKSVFVTELGWAGLAGLGWLGWLGWAGLAWLDGNFWAE